MAKKVRLGIIGVGNMGRAHLKAFLQISECEVAAVADVDPAALAAKDVAVVAARYSSAEAMFKAEKLDAVVIAVPNKYHHEITLLALDQGAHVLCEKPMAMNVPQCLKMDEAAQRAGRKLMINFTYRFDATSFAVKEQVEAGRLGTIYFGRTVWHRQSCMNDLKPWHRSKELSGGGPLIDLGVHRIDLAMWLMGFPEPVSVMATTYDRLAKQHFAKSGTEYTNEDLACGMIKFSNGATLLVEISWALNTRQIEHMETSLYGDKGSLTQRNSPKGFVTEMFLDEGGYLFGKELEGCRTKVPSSQQEFIQCIVEDRQPKATAADGIRVQKILDGMYKSAATGREVIL